MKSLVSSSALCACVLALAVLAVSCTTDQTLAIDAPASSGGSTDPEPGVAVDPLPTATPAVLSNEEAAGEAAAPPATFDRVVTADLDGDGVITPGEQDFFDNVAQPFSWSQVTNRFSDVVPVDYLAPRRDRTVSTNSELAPIRTTSTTPDGGSIWVPIPSIEGRLATCGDGPGTRLGIESITSSSPSVHAEPVDELPHNISEIHHGPNDRVIFYSSCNGETRPVALATVRENGSFTDILLLDPLLLETTSASAPSWIWGELLPSDDFGATGSLIVSVPQRGLSATGQEPGTPSQVFIDANTGRILDVWPTSLMFDYRLRTQTLQGNLEQMVLSGLEEPFDGPFTVVAARGGSSPAAPEQVLLGTADGATLLTAISDYNATSTFIEDGAVTAAAWTPVGRWVVVSGPDAGTRMFDDREIVELSDMAAESLYFSPDGATLVIAATGSYQVLSFERVETPDDTATVTAFSQLDSGGLGPIRVEALVSEIEQQIGMDLTLSSFEGTPPGGCVAIFAPRLPGVFMLGEAVAGGDARITAVIVTNGPWTTPSGLRVGSAQPDVFAAFPGQLRDEPHLYSSGNYLTFEPADPDDNYSVKFETNGHQVISMHAGREEWIGLVEGCA